jgi:N-acetylglucosaminyl-diphospho-decaprenol L-rhamnosyltransferase
MLENLLVSVIILTWNSEKYVERCLASLMDSLASMNYEIILVDNGSTDHTLGIVRKSFPHVSIIVNEKNVGVAPARNQGIRASHGTYILILDIDTYVHKNAVTRLVTHMEDNKKVGLCGPQLCYEDGTVQNSCRRFPLLHTKILRRINTGWAKKIIKDEYYFSENEKTDKDFIDVDYVIGACQLIRREAVQDVGLLDDKIFYGPEDVDFCLRLWMSGWKVQYLPGAKVIHFEQRITKKRFFSYVTFKHIQGLMYYFVKHRYAFSRESVYRRIMR